MDEYLYEMEEEVGRRSGECHGRSVVNMKMKE
jgi:hypothetical protein